MSLDGIRIVEMKKTVARKFNDLKRERARTIKNNQSVREEILTGQTIPSQVAVDLRDLKLAYNMGNDTEGQRLISKLASEHRLTLEDDASVEDIELILCFTYDPIIQWLEAEKVIAKDAIVYAADLAECESVFEGIPDSLKDTEALIAAGVA